MHLCGFVEVSLLICDHVYQRIMVLKHMLIFWDDTVYQISPKMIPLLFIKRQNNGRRGVLSLYFMPVLKLQGLVKTRHKIFYFEPKYVG
jgi:hypothetical protein